MNLTVDETHWALRLRAAIRAADLELGMADAVPQMLADTGLAHLHFRLPSSAKLARMPKQSQMRSGVGHNLAYQAACFHRIVDAQIP